MKKPLLMVFATLCMHVQLFAQVSSTKDIISKLQTLSADRVIEKAYLHFDKPYYDPGDTIYFKAYVTAGERHELSKISGILHVDLLSKTDSVMQSIILPLINGQANADFALPSYVTKGNYRVRAYTQWMLNAGTKYFFDKTIPVTGRSIARVKATDTKTDVQFFAEGGSFVADLPGKISFKAIGTDGLGIAVKGVVVDNLDKEITKFTTAHLGMGQFFITPESGKTYRAKLTYPDGKIAWAELPKAEAKGMTLSVNNDATDKLGIEMNANKPFYLENKNKEVTVVIYNGGIVKTVKTILDDQILGFDLPKKDLRTGVVQITLFSAGGVPMNERLAFIQNADAITLTANTDRPAYVTRGKVQISLNAKTADMMPANGNFSVSVINGSKVTADDNAECSILSDLLLTTDLTGYVEQPGYYFTNVNADTRKNLDILMLTQGYRRFVWKELLNDTPVNAYKPEGGLQIKGTLTNAAGEPVNGGKVTLFARQSGLLLNAVADAKGRFIFDNISFLDKTTFVLKTEATAKNKLKVTLDNTFDKLAVNSINSPVAKPADDAVAVYNQLPETNAPFAGKPLKTVFVNDKSAYRSSNLAGAGHADQVINRSSFKNASTLSLGLDGVARNIKFEDGKAYLRNNVVLVGAVATALPMLIVVDGAIASGSIDTYNPSDVESVEILRSSNTSMYGMSGGGGVIIINTRRGGETDEVVKETAPGLLSIMPQGFYRAREFYSPNIAVNGTGSSRSTVYWQPNLTTDKDGNASFSFNNTGLPGVYRVVVEGIDANGNLGRTVLKYNVQ